MQDDVFGFGPCIRPYRYPRQNHQPGGLPLVDRSPSETSLLSICDDSWGLLIYDYEEVGLFQRHAAEVRRNQLRDKRFGSVSAFLNGCCEIRHHSASLDFDASSLPDPQEFLISLLCRAFGYEPLYPEALRFFSANPYVSYDGLQLGRLQTIIANAKNAYVSELTASMRRQ